MPAAYVATLCTLPGCFLAGAGRPASTRLRSTAIHNSAHVHRSMRSSHPLPLPPAPSCSEDHLYGDKEKFVTSAYRAKLAERQAWLEEQKKK